MHPTPLRLELSRSADSAVLVVAGELDMLTVGDASAAAATLLDGDRTVLLDLRDVSFIDSHGLRWLIQVTSDDRRGWSILPSWPVQRVIEVSGLSQVLPVTTPPRRPQPGSGPPR